MSELLHATFQAIKDRDPSKLKRLLKRGANPNARCGSYNGTLLHHAVEANDPEIVKLLLESGARPNAWDILQRTALHDASEFGSCDEIIRLLLQARARVNLRTKWSPPLYLAAHHLHPSIVRILLKDGKANPDLPGSAGSPIHSVLEVPRDSLTTGHSEIILELLDAGADITLRGRNGLTAEGCLKRLLNCDTCGWCGRKPSPIPMAEAIAATLRKQYHVSIPARSMR